MKARIAIAGAGIYGATAAIKLAQRGHAVTLFDPLGILRASSAINQYRFHAGYHWQDPSLATCNSFLSEFAPAIVTNSQHFYAIPKSGSLTSVDAFESRVASFGLGLEEVEPDWMNFDYIERCWRVDEALYDPEQLRGLLESRLRQVGVAFEKRLFA